MIAELVALLHQQHEQLLQLSKDLGVIISMEKSDLKPSSMAQYLWMLIPHPRGIFPIDSRIVRF